jgi:2-phosphosulfolactate phosphatase
MKSLLQKKTISLLLLIPLCLSVPHIHAAEEEDPTEKTKLHHHLLLSGTGQEGNAQTKADEKDCNSKSQIERATNKTDSSSSFIIEILNPKEIRKRIENNFLEVNSVTIQPIGWNFNTIQPLKGKSESKSQCSDTNDLLDLHTSGQMQCAAFNVRTSAILQPQRTNITIVIDVFRAFTAACYILSGLPASYMLTNKSPVITLQMSKLQDPFLIGKAEKGITFKYNIPNSPTRIKEVEIKGRHVLHRTEGGASGILMSKGSNLILAASLANADATVRYLSKLQNPVVMLLPMGHEGNTPSLEDDICAQYIEAQLKGKTFDLSQYHPALREGSGKYFFTEDQWQYPIQDFDLCLDVGRFNFAICADIQDEYAILKRLDNIGAQ